MGYNSKRRRCEEDDNDVKLSDKSVLDCPICFNHLTIPVFQCPNGHITCSSCHTILKPKCPTCSTALGDSRNRAIEKVLESAIVSCCYKTFGCTSQLAYPTKHIHQDNCGYAPYNCPVKDCNFLGSPNELYLHLKKDHLKWTVSLKSRPAFRITKGVKFVVLYEEGNEGDIFFLDTATMRITSIIQDPNFRKAPVFGYKIVAEQKFGSFKFSPVAVLCLCAKDAFWNKSGIEVADDSKHVLQILEHFHSLDGRIMLKITES